MEFYPKPTPGLSDPFKGNMTSDKSDSTVCAMDTMPCCAFRLRFNLNVMLQCVFIIIVFIDIMQIAQFKKAMLKMKS